MLDKFKTSKAYKIINSFYSHDAALAQYISMMLKGVQEE